MGTGKKRKVKKVIMKITKVNKTKNSWIWKAILILVFKTKKRVAFLLALLSFPMKGFMYISELAIGDMSINLSSSDIFMTQKFLDASDVGPGHQ